MKLKVIGTLLIFFVLSYSISAQIKSAKVTYTVTGHVDEDNKLQKMIIKMNKGYIASYGELEFTLLFNEDKSLFFLNDKLFSDKNSAEMALAFSGYFGRVEQKKDYFITENLEEEFGRFLVKRTYQEWTLINETKLIDDFLCFKATTTYTTTYKEKTFNHYIVAWYTPKIPYKYGPIGYGDLPGLILELQTKKATYGVSKIEFSEEGNEFKLPELKKIKIISEEELEALAEMYEKKRRN